MAGDAARGRSHGLALWSCACPSCFRPRCSSCSTSSAARCALRRRP